MNLIVRSLLFWTAAVPTLAAAHDPDAWPEFRGPTGDGHAGAAQVPTTWSETENIAWKVPIHDRGWSSPVVSDNNIWLTSATADGKQLFGLCVAFETGRLLHDIKLLDIAEPREIHKTNSYASPTPLIVGDRVVLNFGSYGTVCLDRHTAEEIWRRTDLPCNHWRGPGSSPIAFEDTIILHYDGYDFQYVVALDQKTGQTVWKKDRDIDYGTDDGDLMKAFCTPTVVMVDGAPQLISPTSKATIAYDPRTGDELWRFRYSQFSATARPIFGRGLFFINSGFGKAELFAVRPHGRGDITDSHLAWHAKKSIGSKPSFLLDGDLLFVIHDRGVLTCLEAETGTTVWTSRLGGNFSSSPIYASGHLYFADESGQTTVVKPARAFQKVAVNQLDEGCMASPAVYKNSLLWRTRTHLYRITAGGAPEITRQESVEQAAGR